MKNPKYLSLLGLAMFMNISDSHEPIFGKPQSSGRQYEPSKSNLKPIPKGCKKYTVDGIEVIAISERSAIKKVHRIINKK